MFQGAAFVPRVGEGHGITPGVAEDEEAVGVEQKWQGGIIEEPLGEGGGSAADVFFTVGRVCKDEVEGSSLGVQLGECGEDVLDAEFEAVDVESGGDGVIADEPCVAIGEFHADQMGGSAAQGFEAEGTGPGEQFKDSGSLNAWTEAVKHGLLDEVGCGPDRQSFWDFQDPTAGGSANDAHTVGRLRGGWSEVETRGGS